LPPRAPLFPEMLIIVRPDEQGGRGEGDAIDVVIMVAVEPERSRGKRWRSTRCRGGVEGRDDGPLPRPPSPLRAHGTSTLVKSREKERE